MCVSAPLSCNSFTSSDVQFGYFYAVHSVPLCCFCRAVVDIEYVLDTTKSGMIQCLALAILFSKFCGYYMASKLKCQIVTGVACAFLFFVCHVQLEISSHVVYDRFVFMFSKYIVGIASPTQCCVSLQMSQA